MQPSAVLLESFAVIASRNSQRASSSEVEMAPVVLSASLQGSGDILVPGKAGDQSAHLNTENEEQSKFEMQVYFCDIFVMTFKPHVGFFTIPSTEKSAKWNAYMIRCYV